MTSEEKRLIADCRIMVIGISDFINCVIAELDKSGFRSMNIVSVSNGKTITDSIDMIAEYAGYESACGSANAAIPIMYPFDFVKGAGAIVIIPGDDNELQSKDNTRDSISARI